MGSTFASRIGWALMIASIALWVLLPIVAFLPISAQARLTTAGAMLIVAEAIFWIGAVMAGPEAVGLMKRWWRSWWPAKVQPVPIDPDVSLSPPEAEIGKPQRADELR